MQNYEIDELCRSIIAESTERSKHSSIVRVPFDAIMRRDGFCLYLEDRPEYVLEMLRSAAVQLQEGTPVISVQIVGDTSKFNIGLSEIKASTIGKLVSLSGTVIKIGAVKSIPFRILFRCHHCGCEFIHSIKDNLYSQPERCETSGCNSRTFIVQRDSKSNLYRNYQRIRIQEISSLAAESFKAPKIIDVDLYDDLADRFNAGEIITVFAIVKISTIDEKLVQLNAVHSLFVEANYAEVENAHKNVLCFPKNEFLAFAQSKNAFERLVDSFCPRIHGNMHVKAGMLLCILGGSTTQNELRRIRTDCHMLIVGDPGMGKSQLMCAATGLAPKGIYVCGNTSTCAGLTASITNDGEEYSVEAGALVLADRGLCCIDEFDKMSGDHRVLLEVMEQQRVNIAKAGIVCSLPARASIIAAANPVNGHFNPTKTLEENIKISSPLLSRFDIVFVLCDKPNQKFDKRMAKSVLGKINEATDEESARLDPEFIKQYVKFAKRVCNPKLTREAAQLLQSHYLESKSSKSAFPVTIRYLEALIRLSEAKAKAELRGSVTIEDAQFVISLMTKSREVNLDQRQAPKPGRRFNSKSATLRRYQETIIIASTENGSNFFTEEQLRSFYDRLEVNLSGLQFKEMLDLLNAHGVLLVTGPGKYKLLAA